MNKLKKKVFHIIFIILSISALSFVIVFNTQKYIEHKKSITTSLEIAANNSKKADKEIPKDNEMTEPPEKPGEVVAKEEQSNDENIKFLDSVIYTILIDSNNNIKDIINHTDNELSTNKITIYAEELLSNNKIKSTSIGNLYFTDFSYSYLKGNSLIILDNNTIKSSLVLSLQLSVLIFLVFEVVLFIITKFITNWITNPVKETFEKQKQFIADASHELKTPLSVIVASIDALESNPQEQKWINNIKGEAERMNFLLTDLLELASSEKKEKMETNNLSKIIELSVLTFDGKAFENDVKIDYDIEPNINFNFHENSIRELIGILLDNAIKHSKKKSIINVSLKNDKDCIELLVKNKGVGIPDGEEEKIFERFYRVDQSRNRNENRYGLGLSIAKNIVSNHNGQIKASSNNGVTTFKVLFKR